MVNRTKKPVTLRFEIGTKKQDVQAEMALRKQFSWYSHCQLHGSKETGWVIICYPKN